MPTRAWRSYLRDRRHGMLLAMQDIAQGIKDTVREDGDKTREAMGDLRGDIGSQPNSGPYGGGSGSRTCAILTLMESAAASDVRGT